MSLSEKWEDYRRDIIFINEEDEYSAQRAFYAGAEAWRDASESGALTADLNAEIDHFRSKK